MKKILIGAVGLFLMAACGGNKGSEMGGDGSNSTADSLAQEEALRQAHEAAQAALEQERLDSIRQDSIRQKALERDFENQFIKPLDIVDKSNREYPSKSSSDIKKILKSKGFKITNLDDSGYEWSAKKDGKNPITGAYYKQKIEVGCGARCSMIIEFANKQDARKFYKELDKYNSTNQLNETEFRKVWELSDNYIDVII